MKETYSHGRQKVEVSELEIAHFKRQMARISRWEKDQIIKELTSEIVGLGGELARLQRRKLGLVWRIKLANGEHRKILNARRKKIRLKLKDPKISKVGTEYGRYRLEWIVKRKKYPDKEDPNASWGLMDQSGNITDNFKFRFTGDTQDIYHACKDCPGLNRQDWKYILTSNVPQLVELLKRRGLKFDKVIAHFKGRRERFTEAGCLRHFYIVRFLDGTPAAKLPEWHGYGKRSVRRARRKQVARGPTVHPDGGPVQVQEG
jgi:hypothetical protein